MSIRFDVQMIWPWRYRAARERCPCRCFQQKISCLTRVFIIVMCEVHDGVLSIDRMAVRTLDITVRIVRDLGRSEGIHYLVTEI